MRVLTIVQQKRLKRSLPRLLTGLAILFVAAGAVGAIALQHSLKKETQDTRSQASIADGTVFIRSPQNGQAAAFTKDSERTLQFEIKTQGKAVSRVHLVFNIVTNVFDPPLLKLPVDNGLIITSQELEKTADGFLVSSIIEPKTGTEFSSTDWKPLAELVFTPVRGGTITIAFDTETSTATSSTDGEDLLKHVDLVSYTIIGGQDDTTALPPGVGGPTVELCNVLCFSNAQCGPNQRCFDTGAEKRCRLVTNVSSTSCASPDTLGSNRACNESCTSSSECASGLSCWYNLCRNSISVENVSCTAPTTAQQQAVATSCNSTCNSNADCPNNFRCFTNQCRLATNPSSTSCSPASAPTVSTLYPTKGGVSGGTTAPATPAPTIAPTPSPTPSPTATPIPLPSGIDMVEPIAPDRTALDDLKSFFTQADFRALMTRFQSQFTSAQLATATQFLPVILIGFGVLLLLIVGGFFLKNFLASRADQGELTPQNAKTPDATGSSGSSTASVSQPSGSHSIPELPSSPIPRSQHSLGLQPASAPPSKPGAHPFGAAQESQQAPTETSASSMLERLKAKGVQPPK